MHPLSRFASSLSLASLRDAGGGRTRWPGKAGSTGALALSHQLRRQGVMHEATEN